MSDAKTIWLFREKLVKSGASEVLFQKFVDFLNKKQLLFNEGRMVDASFVLAPRQHNTPEENKQIKDKKGDGLWKDNPHKKCQKDTDALWTRKGGVDYFGYKNHIKSVGLARAVSTTGMFNLVYNMCRYEQTVRLGLLRPEK
ncbi:MAG: hypothetical protein K6C07_01515 [Bacteroidales bacterium]|nr:hypothetical protein [Bacteroidales bacterium]